MDSGQVRICDAPLIFSSTVLKHFDIFCVRVCVCAKFQMKKKIFFYKYILSFQVSQPIQTFPSQNLQYIQAFTSKTTFFVCLFVGFQIFHDNIPKLMKNFYKFCKNVCIPSILIRISNER